MAWADLIVTTDNAHFIDDLELYFKRGFPIFGANREGAKLELDRSKGDKVLTDCGVWTVAHEIFSNYEKAIAYVTKESPKCYVSKPMGDGDRAMSFVPDAPDDLVYKLNKWKEDGRKGEFMLQEKISGIEMAVGGWFGTDGWSKYKFENFEFKKFANDDLGQTCGESGTIGRYVEKSELFDLVLDPCTDYLHSIDYVGYADINCIVQDDGTPGPMEWTTRLGWPCFHNQMELTKGDPARWMKQKLKGEDALKVYDDISASVVLTTGDAPYGKLPQKQNEGIPIRGVTPEMLPHIRWCEMQNGVAPAMVGGKPRDVSMPVTAGDYVCVVTARGETVSKAVQNAYDVAWNLKWPANRHMRTDIGERLEEELPILQKHGFATGMSY
jgi:phosphoribosylamine--glycine ligase